MFLNLGLDRICERYCHLHPTTDLEALKRLLAYKPKFMRWAGADLFVVTNDNGERQLCVIETNSCPSGFSLLFFIECICALILYFKKKKKKNGKVNATLAEDCHPDLVDGVLAVVFDKNDMEATGYAASLADVMNEKVYVVKHYDNDKDPPVRFDAEGVMWIRCESTYPKQKNDKGTSKASSSAHPVGNSNANSKKHVRIEEVVTSTSEKDKTKRREQEQEQERVLEWVPVRAAFRYVTQKPWSRIPINTKTQLLNPVLCCLAGGRNKNVAAKAYDLLNQQLQDQPGLHGLAILTPETIKDVTKAQVPQLIQKFGGVGVVSFLFCFVKNPYTNAGQDVYTITNATELNNFMNVKEKYDKFIVQSLIGNSTWSSTTSKGKLFHVGTLPDKNCNTYAADIRMMVIRILYLYTYIFMYVHYSKEEGWLPIALYSRRARAPLVKDLSDSKFSSWDMLGTNLSEKKGDNAWNTDTARLLIMDRKDFNKLGIHTDDLIHGFVQTVLAVIAIDQMAQRLVDSKGNLDARAFQSFNDDNFLIQEVLNVSTSDFI
ncbi:hypothetical protein RFI_03899 [Reticulomyxa filosa]|uniref:Uncharacterized protein n=1 Tax=Reticulomyxa filosa TaxID=46433 RepID=X6P6G1_RETFI|nr:hypothetical protein RFI_03899 [Reticulomyxa filosa]|eukprot:ETO33207.1 hypothetical protein RFI_03899 [Reticulomyxa filosa]